MTDLNKIQKDDIMDAVRKFRTRFKNVGYALIALGILAILFPLVFSIAAKTLLGWLFLLTGGVMLYHAFQSQEWQSAIWSGLIALMHLALGAYLGFFALHRSCGPDVLDGGDVFGPRRGRDLDCQPAPPAKGLGMVGY